MAVRRSLCTDVIMSNPLRRVIVSIMFLVVGLLTAKTFVAAAGYGEQAEQPVNAAAFPFYDGFETGTLGADWTISTTNQGRAVVSSTYAYSGTYSLLLDDCAE